MVIQDRCDKSRDERKRRVCEPQSGEHRYFQSDGRVPRAHSLPHLKKNRQAVQSDIQNDKDDPGHDAPGIPQRFQELRYFVLLPSLSQRSPPFVRAIPLRLRRRVQPHTSCGRKDLLVLSRAAAPSATWMDFTLPAIVASRSIGITISRACKKCTVSRQTTSTFRRENSGRVQPRVSDGRDCSWRLVANFNESAAP